MKQEERDSILKGDNMIGLKVKGDWSKTSNFLHNLKSRILFSKLEKFGQEGVDALSAATPKRTGLTANSWGYEIENTDSGVTLSWTNSNVHRGINIAIILDSGHGTKNGFYVAGRNYIGPAIDPILDEITSKIKEEVSRL